MHEMWNKSKKKGKRVLPVFGERNLAKRMIKNDKKLRWSQVRIGEREKSLDTFEKVILKKSRSVFFFKKPESRYSIDRKIVSINRNNQKLTKDFKRNFDWLKNRLDQSKIWKNTFLEKITWFLKILLKALNIGNKMHEYEMKCFSKTQVLNLVFPKLSFLNILPFKISNTKYVLHKKILKVISNLVGQTKRHTQ